MKTYEYCIQCKDVTTGQIGDFIHESGTFKALSPVFRSLPELFTWAAANGWGFWNEQTQSVSDNRVYRKEGEQ